jgi:hypothetical protein
MAIYKAWRIVDKKPRWVIVDENEKIINYIPTKKELQGLSIGIRNLTIKFFIVQVKMERLLKEYIFFHMKK